MPPALPANPCADMPPVTDGHRREAHSRLALDVRSWNGWSFEACMADPRKAQMVNTMAAHLRTQHWLQTARRTVMAVPRMVLGADGHPIGWVTQLAPTGYERPRQSELQLVA